MTARTRLGSIAEKMSADGLTTLHPLLPLLRFNGEPVTLADHWAMEDLYKLVTPPSWTVMCARQVGKSFNLMGSDYLRATHVRSQRILTVTPRFSQAKTLASDSLRPLIDGSVFKDFVSPPGCERSLLKHDFRNGSALIFSYAFLNADRCRGIPNIRKLNFDEAQDILDDNIKVILQSMSSARSNPYAVYTGTPKGMENPHTERWNKSSQGVLAAKCPRCQHEAIGTPDHDLERMIHPVKRIVCPKCGRPLDLDQGLDEGWVYRIHLKPQNLGIMGGTHIPQPLCPIHYKDETKWKLLMYSIASYDKVKLWNEIYGWPCGAEDQIISRSDMALAADGGDNSEAYMLRRCQQMRLVVVGVDWGGGGGPDARSYTSMCVAGIPHDSDRVEIVHVRKFAKSLDTREGARQAALLAARSGATFIAHDIDGAGPQNEIFIIQAGWPKNKIIPFGYTASTGQNIIVPYRARDGYRDGYSMDKARSLVVLAEMTKAGHVVLPRLDTCWTQQVGDERDNDLMADWTNVYRDTSKSDRGGDRAYIGTKANRSDDTLHACNYACSALWWTMQRYPKAMPEIHWARVKAMRGKTDEDPLAGAQGSGSAGLKASIREWIDDGAPGRGDITA